jgi:hypothetical protein
MMPRDQGSFLGQRVKIVKGSYSVMACCEAISDCIDVHGLCATKELVEVIVDELEFGPRMLDKNSKKRVVLTEREKKMIFDFIHKHRGPHECVLTTEIQSGFSDR